MIVQFEYEDDLRSEGLAVSSPSRKAGKRSLMALRPKGLAELMAHLRRSAMLFAHTPALTDGATNCRSFGPVIQNEPRRTFTFLAGNSLKH